MNRRIKLFQSLVVAVVVMGFYCAGEVDAQTRFANRFFGRPVPASNGYTVVSQPIRLIQPPVVDPGPVFKSPPVLPSGGKKQSPCGCGTSTGHGCVENPGNCDLVIRPGVIHTTKTTEPIKVDPPSDCECEEVKIDFYTEKPETDMGWTQVPKQIKECREVFRFERKTYDICGCRLEICIPCAIDCIETEKCVAVDTEVEMVARIRTNPVGPPRLADIWVYNIKGLPSKAVLALNISSKDANKKFKTNFQY